MVENFHIEFLDEFYEVNYENGSQTTFNSKDTEIIDSEIQKLLNLGVVIKVDYEPGQFVSPIFVRPKKNGEFRMILNLKELNKFIPYRHFKMDTFEKVLNLITKDVFMGSIDLRHAYYSIGIAKEQQKYFRFKFRNQLYQFTACPNGLACLPRLFTKLMKPIYAKLRSQGYVNSGFIDDSILCGNSIQECTENITKTEELMSKVGFVVNVKKSVRIPTKRLVFLGNIIDSEQMKVFLPQEKIDRIIFECMNLYEAKQARIRAVAQVIGLLVSSFSAVEYGKLHYRELEKSKSIALKLFRGNFEAKMGVNWRMKKELHWWIHNVNTQCRVIDHGNPQAVVQTDASLAGWGFVFQDKKVGGRWNESEKVEHINVLELKAIHFAITSLKDEICGKHVKILTDSSTAVCYLANMGGVRSDKCDMIAKMIWFWCIENNVWLSCSHIPGKENLADEPSRKFNDRIEWTLSDDIFWKIVQKMGKPDIDLFATRLNTKLPIFASWKPEPESFLVDAFTTDWGSFVCSYVFPPFSLLGRCIQKVELDKARCLMIAPLWPTQTWFTKLMSMLVREPVILPRTNKILHLPHSDAKHPLSKNLVLIACLVSGTHSEVRDFQATQQEFSCHLGAQELRNSTKLIYRDGFSIVTGAKLIKFQLL